VSPYYEPNAEDFDEDVPTSVIERRPLPIVKQYGWWFVSFAPANFLSVLVGLALLYVPAVLLVVTFSESLGSFGVVLRRDYGPLLTCSLMAWAAGHLPLALIGMVTTRMGLGANTALGLWCVSAVCLTYLTASMYAEAEDALRRFTEKRPYDPEGLYYYGQTREQLGGSADAAELFQRCVEAVKTMPHYRQGGLRKWRKLAQEQLAKLPQPA
jgi:hypothetical protein